MRRIPRPSPALVVACIALLISLGGTSVAAVNALAPNSVGTSQIKNNAVVTAKIKSGGVGNSDLAANAVNAGKIASNSVTAAKIASNAVTSAKIAGNAVDGDKIADGSVTAPKLAPGTIPAPTDAYARFRDASITIPATANTILTLAVPQAGNYVISAKTVITGAGTGTATCSLVAGTDTDESTAGADQTLSNLVVHVFAAAGSVDFRCSGGLALSAKNIKIVATRVGTLTNTG